MTREEEILKAATAHFKDDELLSLSDVRHFKNGVKWADEHPVNVWHDVSEEPQYKNKRILAYSEYFDYFFVDFPSYLMIKDGGQFKNWETVVLRNKISNWAYISDLFPKG